MQSIYQRTLHVLAFLNFPSVSAFPFRFSVYARLLSLSLPFSFSFLFCSHFFSPFAFYLCLLGLTGGVFRSGISALSALLVCCWLGVANKCDGPEPRCTGGPSFSASCFTSRWEISYSFWLFLFHFSDLSFVSFLLSKAYINLVIYAARWGTGARFK